MTLIDTRNLLVITALSTIAQVAYGQICVTSDSNNDTACGSHTLSAPSFGSGLNSAFGAYALTANTTGELNTAIGVQALSSNTTGTSNVAVGVQAFAGPLPAHPLI